MSISKNTDRSTDNIKTPIFYKITGVTSAIFVGIFLYSLASENYIVGPFITVMLFIFSLKFVVMSILAAREFKELRSKTENTEDSQ